MDKNYSEIEEGEYKLKVFGFTSDFYAYADIVEILEQMAVFSKTWRQNFDKSEKKILRKNFDIINKYKKKWEPIYIRIGGYEASLTKMIDEWYYVNFSEGKKYYKCDQFDGFLECLNDIKIIA